MHRHFSFNGTQLKLIALCFMLFDHLKIYLLNNVLPSWTAWIARFVAPLFVYMLVEGFFKTSSRKRYLIRLGKVALITAFGEGLINFAYHNVDPITRKMNIYSIMSGNNILITSIASL